jgi:hypothetical protein
VIARKKVAMFFGAMVVLCVGVAIYGIVIKDGRFLLAGFLGASFYTLCAVNPRDIFIRKGGDE